MTEFDAGFDLLQEPWILVHKEDGAQQAVSIRQIFAGARSIRALSGDIPTQAFALTRLLIAVLLRSITWGSDPVERWSEIWRDGEFPLEEIDSYLDRHRQRFNLLDAQEPFFQVADLATAKNEFKPIELLISDVPSGHKYFTTRTGRGTESLSFAEAARWLVHCHAFDISGIKSADHRDPRGKGGKGYPIGVGWAGQLGGVVFEGRNMFETMLLNTVVLGPGEEGPHEADYPVWEREHPDHRERAVLRPSGPADLLTWQSRRIRLIRAGDRIVSVLIANGDPLESRNMHNVEQMTGWRFSDPQTKKHGVTSYMPAQWNADRALWRGIESLLADIPDAGASHARALSSGVAHWLALLVSNSVLSPDHSVRPHAYGLTYINQSSVIGASVDDSLLMAVALLGPYSEARARAVRAVDCAADAVRALGTLAWRIDRAGGGDGDGSRNDIEAAAHFALDAPFRQWLAQLGNPGVESDVKAARWEREVRRIVEQLAGRIIGDSGEVAWVGRPNAGQWGGEFKGPWLDAPLADSRFRRAMHKALPRAYDTLEQKEAMADDVTAQ